MRKFVFPILFLIPRFVFGQIDTCTLIVKMEQPSIHIGHAVVDLVGIKPAMRIMSPDQVFVFKVPIREGAIQITGVRLIYFDTTTNLDGDEALYIDTTREFYSQIRNQDLVPLFLSKGTIELSINDATEEILKPRINGPQTTMDYQVKLNKPIRENNDLLDANFAKLEQARMNHGDTIALKKERTLLLKKGFDINRKYIRENPNSVVSIQALKMMGTGDPTASKPLEELQKLFDSLSAEVKNTRAGKAYADKLLTTQDMEKLRDH